MGWDRGRAGITQHANFLIRADDSFRLRQLDPTIAAAGAHHRVRFGHVVQQRRIDAVLAAVFVGNKNGLDAAMLASANRKTEFDENITGAVNHTYSTLGD